LQKPNLCVRCQVLHEIAYPTMSPDLQEIRYLHPGLLRQLAKLFELADLVGFQPLVLFLPSIRSLLRDPHLPDQFRHRQPNLRPASTPPQKNASTSFLRW
jgi:hypothetical protein